MSANSQDSETLRSSRTRHKSTHLCSSRGRRTRFVLGLASIIAASLSLDCRKLTAEPSAPPATFEAAETIYDGGLKSGWQDWGWGTHELKTGAARLNLSEYGGWILHHDPLSTRFGALVFRMFAPSSYGNFLAVRLANGNDDKSLPSVDIEGKYARKLAGGWLEISIPWAELNPSSATFDRVIINAKGSVGSDWVLFDKIVLTRADAKASAPVADASAGRVKLAVNCLLSGHVISPYIYGVAGSREDVPATARRWGGNPMTRYNWQLGDAYNVGKDWYFENGKTEDYRSFLRGNLARHAISALTVPMIGWVAKDTSSVGFPVSVYGAQRGHDPNRPDAGDGVLPNGSLVRPKSPSITSVAAPPEMMQKWVEEIRAADEKAKTRSVKLYILDNEPSLWNTNHRDVHPDPLSYDELLDRAIRYGTAIRTADPQALIAGPAEWGWTSYFYSAADQAAGGTSLRPDRRAHGDVPLIPWYLRKLKEHDRAPGASRVLDVLDVHYYPQANGVWGPNSDPATAALRLRSTRSLWDPTYKDESWINDTIRLIPRLRQWVQQNYPGLGISIGEYNFGAEEHISGGLAVAEALGRFGTEGIDYAFYWFSPPKDSPAAVAFRAYRDFDGKGGQFLNHSLDTRMAPGVSLFASRDDSRKHLVLVLLNLEPTNQAQVKVSLDGCAQVAKHRKFSYVAGAQSLIDEGEKTTENLEETLAPYSINVLDVWLK